MKRRKLVYGSVAVAAVAAGAGRSLWTSPSGSPSGASGKSIGQGIWEKSFTRPEGGELAMALLRGRPLLLNFWATWCPPCVKEMPMIDAFFQAQRAANWQVVGLAVDSPTPVREFLARVPVSFPIGLAGMEGSELSRALGNPNGSLPFTVVLNQKGEVVVQKLGSIEPSDLAAWARDHS
jgi:thiol-disulfide isomerase/thioredoxin